MTNDLMTIDPTSPLRWYVIQTKPRKEEEATVYLRDRGLEILSPIMEHFVLRNGRIAKELKPLFPSYIFGRFDIDSNYPLVRWGRGVKKVLGFGGMPTPVSEEAIEIIKSRTNEEGIVKISRHFKTNDLVRIKAGPFMDLIGIFERWMPDHERVRVLLSLVGYQPTIELHCSLLEKVA